MPEISLHTIEGFNGDNYSSHGLLGYDAKQWCGTKSIPEYLCASSRLLINTIPRTWRRLFSHVTWTAKGIEFWWQSSL